MRMIANATPHIGAAILLEWNEGRKKDTLAQSPQYVKAGYYWR